MQGRAVNKSPVVIELSVYEWGKERVNGVAVPRSTLGGLDGEHVRQTGAPGDPGSWQTRPLSRRGLLADGPAAHPPARPAGWPGPSRSPSRVSRGAGAQPLVLPGDGPAIDRPGAGVEQGGGAGVERGAGGGDVVHDKDGAIGGAGRVGAEGVAHVGVARTEAGLPGLLGGGITAAQGVFIEGEAEAIGEEPAEEGGLVVAAAGTAVTRSRSAANGAAGPASSAGSTMSAGCRDSMMGAAVAVSP